MDAMSSHPMPPVAILPGLLCDSRMFGDAIARLPQAGVIDGFYGGASTIAAMADYALSRLPGRVSLLGHSMGARVALEIVRRAPERVERLALVDTGVHPVAPGEVDNRHALGALGREHGMAALVDSWLPPMLADRSRERPELVAALRAMCIAAGLDIYAAQVTALLSRPDALAVLPGIGCPTFVIVGAEDRWSPPAQHEAIAAAIPGAVLRVIAGAGHMLPAEAPEAFVAVLAEWLAHPATGSPCPAPGDHRDRLA